MDELEYAIERIFRRVLQERGPIRLVRVLVNYADWDMSYRIQAEFADDAAEELDKRDVRYLDVVRIRDHGRRSLGRRGEMDCQRVWSRMAEDFWMQQAASARQEALVTLAQTAPDYATFQRVQEEARLMREHVERHHTSFIYDILRDSYRNGVGDEIDAARADYRRHYLEQRQREVEQRMQEELNRQYERMALALLSRAQTSTSLSDAADGVISVESLRQALQTLGRQGSRDNPHPARPGMEYLGPVHHGGPEYLYYGGGRGGGRGVNWLYPDFGVGTKEAREKGKKLLIEHLTPTQKEEYEKTGAFTVTGQSGQTYRIKEGRQMNIDVLDKNGKRTGGICFLPEGQLVVGDCMLAQKIALETCEDQALAVANRFSWDF